MKGLINDEINPEKINWLPVNNHFEQFISSMSFELFNNMSPADMNDAFKTAGPPSTITTASLLKLSWPLRKSNHGQKSISLKKQLCGVIF